MPKAGPGRGSSSAASRHPRSSSTGRVAKGKQTFAASTAIAQGSVCLDGIDTNLLHANYLPPSRSPIRTRQLSGASRGNSGQQQQQSTSGSTSANIPTRNEFDVLSDNNESDGNNTDDDDDDDLARTQEKGNTCNTSKERRPPPIYVLESLADDVDELLEGLAYCLKICKSSVQVITLNRRNFDKVVQKLKLRNFKFYTFDPVENVPVKIVLQGYKDRPIDQLEKHLLDAGVKPREIKILSRKTTVTGMYTLYLLYFAQGSVKIQDPTDAAQCHRCQKFGHGSRNCNLQPRCVKCGETHLSEDCSLPRKENLGENRQQLKSRIKCANCGGNHTGNYRGCATRKTYLEEQEKRKKKPAASRDPLRTTSSTVPGAGNLTVPKSNLAFPPGWGRSYASVAASGGNSTQQDNVTGEDLLTLPELKIEIKSNQKKLQSSHG